MDAHGRGATLAGLAREARRGDTTALGRLLEELYPRVRLFYRRWLVAHADRDETVQDLAQEALIRIAERVATCRAEADGQVVEWAFVVARRVGVDHLRAGRAAWRTGRGRMDPGSAPATEPCEPSDALRLAGDLVAAAYTAEPERVQDVLWLRLVERCTWEEVGVSVGSSAAGAKRIFQRAQQRLRAATLHAVQALPPCERDAVQHWIQGGKARSRAGVR